VSHPLRLLERWVGEAGGAGSRQPRSMTLVTCGADGRPSARVVSLKRIEPEALVFTTGLWTRKATESRADPNVAAVFFWPARGRQVSVEGKASMAERQVSEALFAERPRSHQLQTLASRQGEEIESLDDIRDRLQKIDAAVGEERLKCPEDWGAIRISPARMEFWEEAADRIHERLVFEADAEEWRCTRLAP
jgi:pyridoxamine 5'-phosphate oxidase